MYQDAMEVTRRIEQEAEFVRLINREFHQVVVGQEKMLERLLIGLLADGHILLEGVPGLAKTTAIRTLAGVIDASFSRIQFTPDLLPADLIGTMIYNQHDGQFHTRKGPLFASLVLADEINRSPAKVQSALLEAMQERQVTIGGESYKLEQPFLVLATQNPIEQEGTYPLPEAQVDRFMLKLKIDYPEREEEREILQRMSRQEQPEVNKVIDSQVIVKARLLVEQVVVERKIEDYILDIVFATRNPEEAGLKSLSDLILFGASPRASIYLIQAARAHAFLRGRGYVVPDDIKLLAHDVLRHRIGLTFEAEAENMTTEDIIDRILNHIETP